jgi:hypothetical protein
MAILQKKSESMVVTCLVAILRSPILTAKPGQRRFSLDLREVTNLRLDEVSSESRRRAEEAAVAHHGHLLNLPMVVANEFEMRDQCSEVLPSGKRFGSIPWSTCFANVRRIPFATSAFPVNKVNPGKAIIVSRPQSVNQG